MYTIYTNSYDQVCKKLSHAEKEKAPLWEFIQVFFIPSLRNENETAFGRGVWKCERM